jgi:hypothetical protein
MANKKKKKVNLHAQQKVQAAQHRKQFMERLRKLCTIIGDGEPLFDLLPNYILTAVYEIRGVAPKIKVAKDAKITKRFVKIMYCHLENEMKNTYIDLMIPGITQKVNLVDYYQILLSFESVLASPACIFTKKEKFDAFTEKRDERYDIYADKFIHIITYACITYTDLSKHNMYTYTHEAYRTTVGIDKYAGMFYQIITLDVYPLDVRHVAIHGDHRPVIQTGEVSFNKDAQHLNINTVSFRRLYIKDPSGKKEVPVYIQQHAIDRTFQRMCCEVPGEVSSLINDVFINKRRIIPDGDKYFVECYLGKVKIGYFICMLIDNIFVILTFLLITHSGTPEGRRLSQITGLKREDMEFLAIDNLKTLINSDITKDPRIKQIFNQAGCRSILQMNYEFHTKGYYKWLKDDSKQDTELSRLITEYIQLGASDEEYYENE